MAIDPSKVGTESGPLEGSWTSKDALLYALGVGAGTEELQFTTENSIDVEQQVLPTFTTVVGLGGANLREVGDFDLSQIVHGEQAVELHKPLPPEGQVEGRGRITGIWDKGSGAVIETETTATLAGEPLFTNRSAIFVRGEGGFGGERGPSASKKNLPPEREPDETVTYETLPQQALLYRLNGDRNPLHSDPEFAKKAGFDRPILHGLCTFGFTGRALLHALCDGDSARFVSMEGRFSSPVYPGDALTVSIWIDGTEAVFQTERAPGEIVLGNGKCVFRKG